MSAIPLTAPHPIAMPQLAVVEWLGHSASPSEFRAYGFPAPVSVNRIGISGPIGTLGAEFCAI